ncbi:MAG: hypothetical protein K8H86_12170 [Ignavibacteriaceae bacterium]|nr:hypothetical protein [Ignavibacteriaceae bacterium]
MKKILIPLGILFSATLFAQNVSVTDYKVPISKAQTLRFDGAWNWAQNGDNVTANNATANLLYKVFYSSLPLAWDVNVAATGGKNKADLNHNVVIESRFRKYIWEQYDWFALAQLNAQHANFYKDVAVDLTVGFGYGRYINATALAKAVRIEEHLMRDKIISGHLPKDVMIGIANIIEREKEFFDVYGDTYQPYWYDAIEQEIKKSDVLEHENVGSLGILRMQQVLLGINERVNERYYGWDVSSGILFPLSTFDKSPVGNPNLTLQARYSFPISWQTQINAIARTYTPLDSVFFKEVTVEAGFDFIYELSNRINFVSGYRYGLVKPSIGDAISEHNLNASFWYYLENNIYLTISGSMTKQGTNPRLLTTQVGIQYNLF